MSKILYKKWDDLISHQDNGTFPDFWEKYSTTEAKIYTDILSNKKDHVEGTFQELVDQYDVDPVIFMGFLDGIDSSLKEGQDYKNFDEESQINMDIDFEELYMNMLRADADHLFSLEAWDNVFSEEKRAELTKKYKKSRTIVKEKTPGRNDPCPCGSGKKYKKCCGRNL